MEQSGLKNEVRYYLTLIKECMAPLTEEEKQDAALNIDRMPEARMEPRTVFKPSHLITVVQLPTGAKEVAINTDNIAEKIDYILDAYDEHMHLKTNQDIIMLNMLVV